ncbi:hypothetical protein [Ferrimonas kyonanensis]|uniref:hypothetical protein n=1 Tax=Ferrimonas kyonanensis TaxID=364763 RepID=UPI0012EB436C|nr:hypothetical protein [Ferrimonas kyonanensis]
MSNGTHSTTELQFIIKINISAAPTDCAFSHQQQGVAHETKLRNSNFSPRANLELQCFNLSKFNNAKSEKMREICIFKGVARCEAQIKKGSADETPPFAGK